MDNKTYILDKEGNYYCSKTEYDADSEKRADNFSDGITLNIYDESAYAVTDYAVSINKHWYLR